MNNQNYSQDSYTLKPKWIKNKELRKKIYEIADSFYLLKHTSQPIFFTNMINNDITFNGLHSFFASLREILIRKTKDPWNAIYQPIYTRQKNNEESFPLHYDMFIPKILFMIYNDVPQGKGGTSTFLSTKELKNILLKTKSFPQKNRKLFTKILLKTERHNDQYDVFWNLIHNENNIWYEEIHERIESKQQFVKFKKGEGFMVHDRLWLHGRTKTRTKIGTKRVIRLVFNTQRTTTQN